MSNFEISGAGKFTSLKLSDSSSHTITMQANQSAAASPYTLTLPTTSGIIDTSGRGTLMTNGLGGTSWVPTDYAKPYEDYLTGSSDLRNVIEMLAGNLIIRLSGSASISGQSSSGGIVGLATGSTSGSSAALAASDLTVITGSGTFPTGVTTLTTGSGTQSMLSVPLHANLPSYFKVCVDPTLVTTTNKTVIIGFVSDTSGSSTLVPTGAGKGVFFRIDAAGSAVNIFAVTKNGANTETTVDTGILDVADNSAAAYRVFEIIATTASASFIVYNLDGTIAFSTTISTNIPTTNICPSVQNTTNTTANTNTAVDYFKYAMPTNFNTPRKRG